MCSRGMVLLGLCLLCWLAGGSVAPAANTDGENYVPRRELRVGVYVAPPFVQRGPDGSLRGLALDLWHDVARDLGWTWSTREYGLGDLLEALRKGEVDVGVSALSITPEREGIMDFSQPFYYTGLGIAVPARHGLGMLKVVLRAVFSWEVLFYVGSLFALLLFVGALVWFFEHRRNPENFRPGGKGLGDGLWWSAVTMTSVGYGDSTPKTLAGRAVAMVWMFASVALLASFTAGITSLVTVRSMGNRVEGAADLEHVRVGVVGNSVAAGELSNSHIGFTPYDSVEDGLTALGHGQIDAFVHDQPILHYYQLHAFQGVIRVLAGFFDPQLYGFAFPRGSPLRKGVNVALLRRLEDYAYRLRLFGPYIGKAGVQ